MQIRNRWLGRGIACAALMGAFGLMPAKRAQAGDPPVTVRPAIRISVSRGSTPTARFVQYGYYSGGWGTGNSYVGWGGNGWGGYGGWGAYGGNQSAYAGLGNYAPVYGTYYGGYVNYGYPVSGYGLSAYAYPGFGAPAYGYGAYGYPGYSGCGCGSGAGFGYGGGYGYGGYGYGSYGFGGPYGLGYRIW